MTYIINYKVVGLQFTFVIEKKKLQHGSKNSTFHIFEIQVGVKGHWNRRQVIVVSLGRPTFVYLPKMINEVPALWHYLVGKMSSLKGNEVDIDERRHSQQNPLESDIR